MSLKYNGRLTFASLALTAICLVAAHPVHAQTTVSGDYDNGGDGYTTTSGDYTVVSPATFDDNTGNGFQSYVDGDTVSVTGGQFDGNRGNGLVTDGYNTLVVDYGEFTGNGAAGVSVGRHGVANVYGGVFSGNALDFEAYFSTITIYGDFATYGTLQTGSGSFTGTLQNDTTSQTFTYDTIGIATVTLAPETVPSVPEPSSVALFALGALGLIGLGIRARKRGLVGCG